MKAANVAISMRCAFSAAARSCVRRDGPSYVPNQHLVMRTTQGNCVIAQPKSTVTTSHEKGQPRRWRNSGEGRSDGIASAVLAALHESADGTFARSPDVRCRSAF